MWGLGSASPFTGNEELGMRGRFGEKALECYFKHTELDMDLNHLSKVGN